MFSDRVKLNLEHLPKADAVSDQMVFELNPDNRNANQLNEKRQ